MIRVAGYRFDPFAPRIRQSIGRADPPDSMQARRNPPEGARLSAMQGVVKVYDPITGAGIVVVDEDRSEVYLRAGSLAGSVFRLLRQGQRINFDVERDGGRPFAHSVRMGSDGR